AYLLLPRELMMVGAARKRIDAIKQYSSLGAGFRVAMRDLEIRGAGSILGTAQSGHIMAVGFDLYCQLLKQAVAQINGQKPRCRLGRGKSYYPGANQTGRRETGNHQDRKAGGQIDVDEARGFYTCRGQIPSFSCPGNQKAAAGNSRAAWQTLKLWFVPSLLYCSRQHCCRCHRSVAEHWQLNPK